jgi:hypothetical protein
MKRGCSKSAVGSSAEAVEGIDFQNFNDKKIEVYLIYKLNFVYRRNVIT